MVRAVEFTREERSLWVAEIRAVAANVRRLRKAAGLTQMELGRRIGCSKQMIQQIEAGNTDSGPPYHRLVQIAVTLGLKSTAEFYVVEPNTAKAK